jgi:hypothetical protein
MGPNENIHKIIFVLATDFDREQPKLIVEHPGHT